MAIFRTVHDPGLGEKYLNNNRRIINKDGSFNVMRRGGDGILGNLYFLLINMPWWQFLLLVFSSYVLANCVFACIYVCIGIDHLKGAELRHAGDTFFDALFFSFQTFTSVGYGGMVPQGLLANIVSSTEAFVGLSSFALVTGLLYGRFSRPSSHILFSKNALVSPHKNADKSLQFRVVNRRHNVIMELEARVLLIAKDLSGQTDNRKYYQLPLETPFVHFFPLNWTIVHLLNEESPLSGFTEADFKKHDVEILILLKGFDDTFGQVVYQRFSYKYDEIVHGARFTKTYDTDQQGHTIIDVDLIHGYEKIEEPVTAN